jgi:hypothetical protein
VYALWAGPKASALGDDQIFVTGTTPGFRARVDALAPAPAMGESLYQVDQHNAVRAYDEATRMPPTPSQAPGR